MPRLAALLLLLSALGLASCASGSAVTPLDHLPALKGDYFPIRSREAGRRYHIYVRLPEGYEAAPERRYPVIYLLDGDSLFPILAANHLFLTYDEPIPEAIVVGVAYGGFDPAVNKRGIDFTPPGGEGEAGAPAFLRFLKSELLPLVEQKFRADPLQRVLVGQSRGGSFVMWSAMEDPDLFWGRIASNPSLEPGRDRFFADAAPASRRDLGLVYASGTRDRPALRDQAAQWKRAWQGRSGAPWAIHAIDIPDGTHAASIVQAYRTGLLWLFGRSRSADPT